MALMKRNPAGELDVWNRDFPVARSLHSFQREMNRMLDNFFHGDVFDEGRFGGSEAFAPMVDVSETKDTYVIKAELPGLKKEDVKVTMNNNIVTIAGEKKIEEEKREGNFYRMERSFGSFERSIAIPGPIKADAIECKYADGLLTLSLPKTEEAKQKVIDVKVK
ncbi:MAG TPA: Hsp20/alpha crystallin family protein [Bacteroidota bacterium]|nr:Hsp20/alpha crystallin family protein [Bacteroidota bacterium]